ncbi:MAG: cytochrome c [Verrucomicrobiales bacterium]|nr:cytochrome c [Verrucomicrobiales bacterium]
MNLKRFWILWGAPALLLASCASWSLDYIAPPVAKEDTALWRGRRVYLIDCTRCHSAEPVSDYTRAEWRDIMPEMIKDSRLTDEEARAVTAYVMRFARAEGGGGAVVKN